MKFLPLRDFDVVTSALNFSTPDCRVTGGCDLYTTKATGSEKKLYKNIECSLESQHAALVKFGASLSPPQRREMAASMNLSRSSPFGPLSDVWSRRTFAYLIATLNASHPDYDFSHVLRPSDFRREKDLRHLMANFDNTLSSVRPVGSSFLAPNYNSSYHSTSPLTNAGNLPGSSPVWGPQMWAMIDKEMALKECSAFSYQPAEDPFDGDEAAIWRMHYFFFNRAKKRVAYLYVRGLPIIVNSPGLAPRRGSIGLAKRHAPALSSSLGANKRAKYWLGDQLADRIISEDDDEEEDAVIWDPDEDVDIDPLKDPDPPTEEESDYESSEGSDDERGIIPSRGVSEEVAGRMEIE